MTQCCHQPDLARNIVAQKSQLQTTIQENAQSIPDRFLSTSYFIAMLVTLGYYPVLLRVSRLTEDTAVLFSNGCLGIALLIFTVVSFLYYSEADTKLKKGFAQFRILVFSLLPLLFWWAFHTSLSQVSAPEAPTMEWAVTFGLSSSLFLLFVAFVVKLKQKQLLTCYLFLSAALCIYSALVLDVTALQSITQLLALSGVTGLIAFALQTQSGFRKKCQHVELLVLLSVVLQCSAVPLLLG